MSVDLEAIRERNPIADVIHEKFALRKSGSRFIGVEHDSLVVTPATALYFWNSRGEGGDVFDFVGRHILNYSTAWNNRDPVMFLEAVRWLAQRAGIELQSNADLRSSPTWSERQLIERMHDALLHHAPALDYVTKTRGWQMATIRAARIGYLPNDRKRLIADLKLTDTWKNLIGRFPADMIVYVHLEKGRLVYLSGRGIGEKRHYNPPRELLGDRRPYFNHVYSPEAEQIVVVEGQADAITFAEWGIPSVALGGMVLNDLLAARLKTHRRVFVALDNAGAAPERAREIASSLRGETYLPQLPHEVKDSNEWLAQHGATAEDAHQMLNRAKSWLEVEVQRIANWEGLARRDAIRDLFQYAVGMDEYALAEFKTWLNKIGIKGRAFSDLLHAARGKTESPSFIKEASEPPQILGDDVPLLSPALGFHQQVALVTVTIIERTANNQLNRQPYLVTSNRELRRLSDEQIIQLGEQEVALRVLPEGCEFLMRWRYSDIQRFLDGETVAPGDVFQTVHDLFTKHIDFRSPVESAVLTLWVLGTYFYAMFPAYPYLALNGPKNSGKSTVMRVAQPLAFNMVNTSDPTGPSMFRLIHTTSCTVGIDEAERFHNPRDPGMQQIRQLLNSGYKAGMPAIRLIGEDMKPQAFDVYSPKILAAIAGLEDILASRCIAIPMRRTDKKMPIFPPDFDGASIRHQLYTLALTHFPVIYHNYFERPELHTLHNRSGELWSPLVALAAFFEEEGRVKGLLTAISEAAVWDEQISEGKALSDREEAVLQALELLTRERHELTWIKASELRDRVARLLGQSTERMGDGQWIGHILKRLHLADEGRRKRANDGIAYAVLPDDVRDMMRRYDVALVETGQR